MSGGPSVVIVMTLEEQPSVRLDFVNSGDEDRMLDWIESHPSYGALLAQAIALSEKRPQ
jgi:hypothetical protein